MEPRRAAPGEHGWRPRVATGAETAAELVYHLAGALGTELQELARRFGPEAAAGLVPLVVRALELLEKAAVGPAPDSVSHCPSLCHPRGRRGPNPESPDSQLQVSAQQAELELRRLRDENEHLRRELRCGPQEERALLRQLKEVTDRQRDELRAHNRDLQQRSQETEALQEQLQRLLLVNAELRHKLAAVQTQLRAARDRESERELRRAGVVELARDQDQDQARNLARGPGCAQRQEPELATAEPGDPGTPEDPADAPQEEQCPSNVGQCGFSREELQQILQERNELKANVFLLKEELAYFQRELLTDRRVPGLLLEAMKVAVRKQRKKIKAKMLGTPEEAESSDDEDGSWLLLSSDKEDHPPPPESRIQTLASVIEVKQRPLKPRPAAQLPASEAEKRRPHSNPTWSLWAAPDRPCFALDEHLCLRVSGALGA
ncbi:rab-interacting lysosomal protein isoform X2 [Myotis yumanensis]|uniref:rab-interacting lysosomal protein isoform X2 n=1 Tax=Myotis yumanensis TaxID=159337 RepID=UPI0038D382E9